MHIAASLSRRLAVLFCACFSPSLQFSEGRLRVSVVLGTSQYSFYLVLGGFKIRRWSVASSSWLHGAWQKPETCLCTPSLSGAAPLEGDRDPASTSRTSHQQHKCGS